MKLQIEITEAEIKAAITSTIEARLKAQIAAVMKKGGSLL